MYIVRSSEKKVEQISGFDVPAVAVVARVKCEIGATMPCTVV